MVQRPDVILGPNGLPVWQCDPGTGNTAQAGSMLALDLVLTPEAAPVAPAPGFLKLYSPDGQSVNMITPAGTTAVVSNGPGFTPVAGAGATVTGTTGKTLLATGMTIPGGTLAANQAYRLIAFGTVTTTVDTQTVSLEVDYGGTSIVSWGAQQPNSSAPVTNAPWSIDVTIVVLSPNSVTVSGWDALNFFFASANGATTSVTPPTTKAFTVQTTNSATAVSITCSGITCNRIA